MSTGDKVISSLEVVEVINEFRNKNNKHKLRHDHFMRKIRNVSEILCDTSLFNVINMKSSYIDKNNRSRPCYVLSKEEIKCIADFEKSTDKIPLMKICSDMEDKEIKVVCAERFETTFFNKLSDTLSALNINIELQKSAFDNKYRIDGYIKNFNLAIEYDEIQHCVNTQKSKDIQRQKQIQDKYKYRFLRLDYKNTDAYNIGLVMKEIFKIQKEEY